MQPLLVQSFIRGRPPSTPTPASPVPAPLELGDLRVQQPLEITPSSFLRGGEARPGPGSSTSLGLGSLPCLTWEGTPGTEPR